MLTRKSAQIFKQVNVMQQQASLAFRIAKYSSAIPENKDRVRVTLFPGHGIGPEISQSVTQILEAAQANIEWEKYEIGHPIPGTRMQNCNACLYFFSRLDLQRSIRLC